MALWRLDKIIASQTLMSRKEVKALLAAGRVCVSGAPALRGELKIDPLLAAVTLDGVPLAFAAHTYLLLNKPRGYVSSTEGGDGPSVLDWVPEPLRRRGLFPAGRLDKASEGLLILTDDGDFAHRLLAPRRRLPKRYRVRTDAAVMNARAVAAFAAGLDLAGERTLPALLEPLSATHGFVTLRQGLYHQIRRMFAVLGAAVLELERVRIGALDLPADLARGACRALTDSERALLLTDPDAPAESSRFVDLRKF